MVYPVLAGVPILVAAPAAYCASYREPLIAALAEVDRLDRAALACIDGYAAAAPGAEPARFGDDWPAPDALDRWPVGHTLAGELGRAAAAPEPIDRALERVDRLGVALDLGCGDGGVARRLIGRSRRLVVADLSLRAVLRARVGGAAGVVLEADQPALAPRAFDTIVAANLIDLLEHPLDLPGALAAALVAGGRLVLSTPDPELGGDDAEPLLAALRRAGLTVEVALDRLPWLRLHPPRHAQVYFCLALVARRKGRAGRAR